MSVTFFKSTELEIAPNHADGNPAARSDESLTDLLLKEQPVGLIGDRLLAAQAMQLLMRLDKDLMEARARWNQDWFRRVMRTRQRAALRLQRRWKAINPPPKIALGKLRRRFHANIAMYLYPSNEI